MNKDIIVKENQALIVSIAKRFASKNVSFEDLVQEGNLGLLEAIDRFDESRDVKLITYAYFWIMKYIRNFMYNSHTVKIPYDIQLIKSKINKIIIKYKNQNGKDPNLKELVSLSGLSKQEILIARESICLIECLEDYTTSSFPIQDNYVESKQRKLFLEGLIQDLPENEKIVLNERLKERTLKEIGESIGYSGEHVRQLEKSAIGKLKKNSNKMQRIKRN